MNFSWAKKQKEPCFFRCVIFQLTQWVFKCFCSLRSRDIFSKKDHFKWYMVFLGQQQTQKALWLKAPASQRFNFGLMGFCSGTIRTEIGTPDSPVEWKESPDSWLWWPSCVPQCHALCGPSVGDNELSCQAATLPTVCGVEETGEDDLQGMEAEARETLPEGKRERGSIRGQRKKPRQTSRGTD